MSDATDDMEDRMLGSPRWGDGLDRDATPEEKAKLQATRAEHRALANAKPLESKLSNPTNNDSPDELANLEAKRSLDKSEASVGYVHVHQKCLKCGGCIYECEHQLKTTMTSTDAPGLMYVDGSRANASPEGESKLQQGSESTKLDDFKQYHLPDCQMEVVTEGYPCICGLSAQLLEWSCQEAVQKQYRLLEDLLEWEENWSQLHPDKPFNWYGAAKAMLVTTEVTDPASEHKTEARTSSELQSPQETSDV